MGVHFACFYISHQGLTVNIQLFYLYAGLPLVLARHYSRVYKNVTSRRIWLPNNKILPFPGRIFFATDLHKTDTDKNSFFHRL